MKDSAEILREAQARVEKQEKLDNAPIIALNRIADALFAQADAMRKQTKVSERQAALAEAMLETQKANLGVTNALERKLRQKLDG